MDRREFFFRTGMLSAALGSAARVELAAADVNAPLKQAARDGAVVLANDAMAWRLEWHNRKLASAGFQNKRSGHQFPFTSAEEILLTFSASAHRVEIPWWRFTYGTDDAAVDGGPQNGRIVGAHEMEFDDRRWGNVENLIPRGRPGQPQGDDITYQGIGWYRRWFELPANARGADLHFVLGGYDHQDWLEYQLFGKLKPGWSSAGGRRTPARWVMATTATRHRDAGFALQRATVTARCWGP
jgi:hypothetical protein